MGYLVLNLSVKLEYYHSSGATVGLGGYCDADWGNSSSRRSTTGNLLHYCGAPIHWKSKLQKTIALSTVEAEYYLASVVTVEVIYLRSLHFSYGLLATTSSVDESVRSILTSRSILRMRQSRKAISAWSAWTHRSSWPTFLPRVCSPDYTPRA